MKMTYLKIIRWAGRGPLKKFNPSLLLLVAAGDPTTDTSLGILDEATEGIVNTRRGKVDHLVDCLFFEVFDAFFDKCSANTTLYAELLCTPTDLDQKCS